MKSVVCAWKSFCGCVVQLVAESNQSMHPRSPWGLWFRRCRAARTQHKAGRKVVFACLSRLIGTAVWIHLTAAHTSLLHHSAHHLRAFNILHPALCKAASEFSSAISVSIPLCTDGLCIQTVLPNCDLFCKSHFVFHHNFFVLLGSAV